MKKLHQQQQTSIQKVIEDNHRQALETKEEIKQMVRDEMKKQEEK